MTSPCRANGSRRCARPPKRPARIRRHTSPRSERVSNRAGRAIRSRQTKKKFKTLENCVGTMSTYNVPKNTRSDEAATPQRSGLRSNSETRIAGCCLAGVFPVRRHICLISLFDPLASLHPSSLPSAHWTLGAVRRRATTARSLCVCVCSARTYCNQATVMTVPSSRTLRRTRELQRGTWPGQRGPRVPGDMQP